MSNKPIAEHKPFGHPIDITPFSLLSSDVVNNLQVTWNPEPQTDYCVSVDIVRHLTSEDLLGRLKRNGVCPTDHTRALIKDKLTQNMDSEISATSLRISLLCPLGKTRMSIPCRPSTCQHLQCFDGATFLQMNEKKSTWLCPVCDKPADYSSLIIDGLFTEILSQVVDCNDVEFNDDGNWSPIENRKPQLKSADDSVVIETVPDSPVEVKSGIEMIDLTESDDEFYGGINDDSDSCTVSCHSRSPSATSTSSGDIEVITLE